ncbi:MAG: EamA family transporter [Oceanipulchritudo sp.]
MQLYYLNPLLSALIFALASIAIKRAMSDGAGATRSVFVTNTTFFIALFPLWWIVPEPFPAYLLWVPVAAGLAAFLGSIFQFVALKLGDVSVATPLLGSKVLFVAFFSTLILGNVLPLSWWIGAILAGLGIFFLGQVPGKPAPGSRLGLTIFLSLLSVICFAMMDILIAGWGKTFGFPRFVVIQQLIVMVLSLGIIPFFQGSLVQMPRRCWPWLLAGSLLIVCQFYLLNWTISTFGDPTAINIFYSSRGIWSVLLVWGIGPLFGNLERGHGWGVFWRRILGAVLLFAAICLVVLDDPGSL